MLEVIAIPAVYPPLGLEPPDQLNTYGYLVPPCEYRYSPIDLTAYTIMCKTLGVDLPKLSSTFKSLRWLVDVRLVVIHDGVMYNENLITLWVRFHGNEEFRQFLLKNAPGCYDTLMRRMNVY